MLTGSIPVSRTKYDAGQKLFLSLRSRGAGYLRANGFTRQAGADERITSMTTPGKTTIATIHGTGTGTTTGHQIYVEVDTVDRVAAGYIDTNGEVQLDAAGLRRLAAACLDAADRLDQLTNDG